MALSSLEPMQGLQLLACAFLIDGPRHVCYCDAGRLLGVCPGTASLPTSPANDHLAVGTTDNHGDRAA